MTALTYLGHASFFFETDKAACLIDPWFSPKGAFLGTWRQLPPNAGSLPWVLEKMKQKPVFIYITHEHEDHYDEETLKALLPHAKGLYIPRYENTFLQRLIETNLGVVPTLLDEALPQDFFDITFQIFRDESGINRDSAIFLKSEGFSFFDVNDCKIYDRAAWLAERCGPIDVLSCQFSGANMHPVCYDMPEDEYKAVSRQKRLRKFVAVKQFLADMKPRFYVPSAGPAVFPFPEHASLNFEADSIFPKWWEFRDYLESKAAAVSFKALGVGGSVAPEKTGEDAPLRFEGLAEKTSDDDIKRMIDAYRQVDAAQAPVLPAGPEEVLSFFEREMTQKLAVLKDNPTVRIGCPFFFDIRLPDGASVLYRLDPQRCTLEKTDRQAVTPPYYLHTTSTAALGRLMRSGKGWGTYFLSFQFRSKRVPDVFDSALATFFVANDVHDLDFGLKKLAEFRDSQEYVTLVSSDRKHTVTCKRFCPHQGADLKYARFDGRYVICPRHQWRFDCANGGKADRSSDSIDATITDAGAKTGN